MDTGKNFYDTNRNFYNKNFFGVNPFLDTNKEFLINDRNTVTNNDISGNTVDRNINDNGNGKVVNYDFVKITVGDLGTDEFIDLPELTNFLGNDNTIGNIVDDSTEITI